jgi:hypothetical protein
VVQSPHFKLVLTFVQVRLQHNSSTPHASSQKPQSVSVPSSVQTPLQQSSLWLHTFPQVPQFVSLVDRFRQVPLQSVHGGGHSQTQVAALRTLGAGQGVVGHAQMQEA